MLTELWERLRGYDKWTQTEATITSSELADVEVARVQQGYGKEQVIDEWQSSCTICWKDGAGQPHQAKYKVTEDSPLFQLYEGQTIAIRFDPVHPDRYYLPGVFKSNLVSFLMWRVGPALIGILFLIALFLRIFASDR